jgi:hypothetical protein
VEVNSGQTFTDTDLAMGLCSEPRTSRGGVSGRKEIAYRRASAARKALKRV